MVLGSTAADRTAADHALPAEGNGSGRAPDLERGDHGEVAEGTYMVAGNVVRVEDMEGRSLGGQVLRPTDDPRVVARAILRTAKTPEPFWNPINYTTH
jgi:hypothetical protein